MTETKDEIWDILLEYGANKNQKDEFISQWPECKEFCFMGVFGFGGKIWCDNNKIFVTCYPENETAERLIALEELNERLKNFNKGAL